MDVRTVDPYDVNVDEMNERTERLNLSELEASVEEMGVIQPPLVRERNGDHEVPYTVVVGQRRTLAAQGAGLDELPVIVTDWDDAEALEASITENIDTFREDVSTRDRALAIQRLKQHLDASNVELADRLGVTEATIREWLEPVHEEWEGTIVDSGVISETGELELEGKILDKINNKTLKKVREITGGGEEGEELLKRVADHDLNSHDVAELKQKIKAGRSVDEALAQTIEQKHSTDDIKVKANVTFSGDNAGAIEKAAKDRGMTPNEVVREAISDFLSREGYL